MKSEETGLSLMLSLKSEFVFRFHLLIHWLTFCVRSEVYWIQRGSGAIIILFKVVNDALKNNQIFLADEEKSDPDHKDSLCQCSNMPWLSDKFVEVDKEV